MRVEVRGLSFKATTKLDDVIGRGVSVISKADEKRVML
jgi:hypothetical protein